MSQVNLNTASESIKQILNDIDTTPTTSVQFAFAKLQLAQSQACKSQAESYMTQIEQIQDEQKKTADMISRARELQNKAKADDTTTDMPEDMKTFFKERGMKWETTGSDDKHNKDEWDYNIKSLTNYQETVGNKVQTLMVYLQDFIGQYNSYLQGANTAISNANQVQTNIARGQ